MTTTSVDDAVILPQSQGTGLSGEDAVIDASINGVLNRYVGGEYVATEYSTGLQFQNHDGTNDTVEVGPGIVFIQDNSTSTGGERSSNGNPQAESSTTSGYDTELPEGHTYAVLLPTATEISVTDSTLNEVYVDLPDVTANNSVNLEHDGSSAASPGSTSLKIGETNPDDATADTRANDDASPTYSGLTVNGTTDTDALNAGEAFIGDTVEIGKDGDMYRLRGPADNQSHQLSEVKTGGDNTVAVTETTVQNTTSVTTTAETVISVQKFCNGGMVVVEGNDVTDNSISFCDILIFNSFSGVDVVQSRQRTGAASRSYSLDQFDINLAMASDEYHVGAYLIGARGRATDE